MVIAYRAARLLVNSTAEIIEDGAVLIEGETIVSAGAWNSLGADLESSITVKDLGDVTLMPGLFDCHVIPSSFHGRNNATIINSALAGSPPIGSYGVEYDKGGIERPGPSSAHGKARYQTTGRRRDQRKGPWIPRSHSHHHP